MLGLIDLLNVADLCENIAELELYEHPCGDTGIDPYIDSEGGEDFLLSPRADGINTPPIDEQVPRAVEGIDSPNQPVSCNNSELCTEGAPEGSCADSLMPVENVDETNYQIGSSWRPSPGSWPQQIRDFWSRVHNLFDKRLLYPTSFRESDGIVRDPVNGVIVVGDVIDDISYLDKQTAGSCSLMSQEQFVHRAIGRPIPESYLEWQADTWGVYCPVAGTNFVGQTKILDHFGIQHGRFRGLSLDGLVKKLADDSDAIIGVDTRYFYGDRTFPEGSAHAVAIVGRGRDPDSGDTIGFYITDSNRPGSVRYMTREELKLCWLRDAIVIPEQKLRKN